MKRIFAAILMVVMLATLLVGNSVAMAAKPDGSNGTKDVIAKSNGFPSGEHYNLNIHGKKADYVGDPTPGGNSVFILEYGKSTIQYVMEPDRYVRTRESLSDQRLLALLSSSIPDLPDQ